MIAILLVAIAVALGLAFWALSVMGRPEKRWPKQPGPENNWENEDYAKYEEGGKLRSVWVSPLSSFASRLVPRRPKDW